MLVVFGGGMTLLIAGNFWEIHRLNLTANALYWNSLYTEDKSE